MSWLTSVEVSMMSRFILFVDDSFVSIFNSCEAALCSDGNSVEVQAMSSKKSNVNCFNWPLVSKSCKSAMNVFFCFTDLKNRLLRGLSTWECLVTQCLRTNITLMVLTLDWQEQLCLAPAFDKEVLLSGAAAAPRFCWHMFLGQEPVGSWAFLVGARDGGALT